MTKNFMTGAAKEIITPKLGARLYGYNLDTIGTSVNDNLTVTAIALCQNDKLVILISASVCLINTELAFEVRKKVASAVNTGYENIILSATHTHSGPCTANMTGWGDIDRSYCDEIFIPQAVKAARKAVSSLKPAEIGIGAVKSSSIGINRRQFFSDNRVILGQNPLGSHDNTLTVIHFRCLSGEPIANIIHYGAHCTAAGNNSEITRDWAGVMEDELEKLSGGITAFFNGAEGDSGPKLANGRTVDNLEGAMVHGKLAAKDAAEAYKEIKEYYIPELRAVYGTVKLPCSEVIPLEKAKEEFAKYDGKVINIDGRKYAYYKSVIEAYENGILETEAVLIEQTVVSLGEIVFIPFPFEIFSDISLKLREYSPYKYTLCLGCTNGDYGYLPSEDQLCYGGYEVDMFLTGGVSPLKNDTDKNIINENLNMMEELQCTE